MKKTILILATALLCSCNFFDPFDEEENKKCTKVSTIDTVPEYNEIYVKQFTDELKDLREKYTDKQELTNRSTELYYSYKQNVDQLFDDDKQKAREETTKFSEAHRITKYDRIKVIQDSIIQGYDYRNKYTATDSVLRDKFLHFKNTLIE